MNARTDSDVEAFRTRLVERRAELERLVADSEEASDPVELDQSRVGRLSRIDALQAQEMAKETGRRRQAEFSRIEAALGRIDGGDYGECVTCGEDIAAKRLELDPAVAVCIDCARGGR